MLMTQEKMRRRFSFLMLSAVMACLMLCCLPSVAESSTSSSGTRPPWEKALTSLADSLTGPTARALSLIMIVVGVGVLMFGGDLAGWGRWVAFAAIAIGTLASAPSLIEYLGFSSALL